jgi:uncharacterized protein DUF998
VDSFISELEVPGQPDSGFFRYASLLSGVLAAVFAVGLWMLVPPGRRGAVGCAALLVFGLAGAADALVPMDCAPSASAVCFRAEVTSPAGWASSAHTWFDVAGTVALLAGLWLLGQHLRRRPGWRRSAEVGRVGGAVLTALSLLLTAMSAWYLPGTGLVQRLAVVGTSVCLLGLALDVRRSTPEAASSATASLQPLRGRCGPAGAAGTRGSSGR